MKREIFQQVLDLEIRSKLLIQDIFAGAYHSAFKGSGLNFSEVREYVAGDDFRKIDRNVTAKTSKPYIKLFEEERELSVLFLVDVSRSTYATVGTPKAQNIICDVAGVLALTAAKNKDKVGLLAFSDQVEKFIEPKGGRNHILRVIYELFALKPVSKQTSIRKAVEFAMKMLKKKAVIFIISDFYDFEYSALIQKLALKHDVINIQVDDSQQLNYRGVIEVKDSESGQTFFIDTADHRYAKLTSLLQQKKMTLGAKGIKKRASHFLYLDASQDHFTQLRNFFLKRNKLS